MIKNELQKAIRERANMHMSLTIGEKEKVNMNSNYHDLLQCFPKKTKEEASYVYYMFF